MGLKEFSLVFSQDEVVSQPSINLVNLCLD